MKILFLDAYFEPEQIAFTHLEKDLLEGLINAGNEVEIICPVPTRGICKEVVCEYRNRRTESLYNGHVHVKRFWAPQERKNPAIRALRYFWCNLRTYQIGIKANEVGSVFSNSTPPTQGWVAGKVARRLKVPFVYSLQDIFPDSLVTTGLTKQNSLIWKIGRALENTTYSRCSSIVVISNAMKKNLIQKGVDPTIIHVISNWIDLDKIHPIAKVKNPLFHEFGIKKDKFIVLYAGNFGAAQGAEIVLDAADILKHDSSIQFVIFGGGSGYTDAVERAKSLPNVFIHSLLPQERISEVYSIGDVALITCKKGVGKSGMPSKTWTIMACDRPIIASFDTDSELSAILNESQAGICISPEDPKSLAISITSYKNNISRLGQNRTSPRAFLNSTHSKKSCVDKYIDLLIKRV